MSTSGARCGVLPGRRLDRLALALPRAATAPGAACLLGCHDIAFLCPALTVAVPSATSLIGIRMDL